MQIGILGNRGSWYVRDLRRAVEARGGIVRHLDFRLLQAGIGGERGSSLRGLDIDGQPHQLEELTALLVRTMPPGSLEQVVFRMDALLTLQARGVLVVNSPKAIECAVDKYLTLTRLSDAGLPVPETTTCESADAGMTAFAALGEDVVVKPLFGAEGRGIVRLSDEETAFRVFKSLARTDQVLYIQRYIPHDGSDVRVLVLDQQVCGAMTRSSEVDFRTNVSRQGKAAPHTPTDTEVDLAVRAAKATGARFAGVDILYDASNRPTVVEVNAVPGWRALQRVTGRDIAATLVASILNTFPNTESSL